MASYRTGLLIIRAWLEEESEKPLRADVRSTADVSKGFDSARTVTDADAVAAIVQTWLAQFIEGNGATDSEKFADT